MQKKASIVIATGLFPPNIGGPAKYASMLYKGLEAQGIPVRLVQWKIEKRLPTLLRYVIFFFRLLMKCHGATSIVCFDATSVGFPAALVSSITGIPFVVRVGGDSTWEAYVNRTGNPLSLKTFYTNIQTLSFKESMLIKMTAFVLRNAKYVVVNTSWYGAIIEKTYSVSQEKIVVIENVFEPKSAQNPEGNFMLLASNRNIPLKNNKMLETVVANVQKKGIHVELYTTPFTHQKLPHLMKNIYATAVVSFSEVSPNLVLEGLEYGKPFILTKETGLHERFHACGVFIDPTNQASIEEGLQNLIENYDTYKQKAQSILYVHTEVDIVKKYLSIV
ncbi:hypothetical protein IPF86_00835 [Candidatus Nomurabacteria bacterium]|nr:MAG: hypothetical protein IPF86_00835 [Candidatus Nomurabacteria bacterium]